MANPQTQGSESITQAEHISPAKTGDNIEAKRNANYVWDANTSTWARMTQPSITTGDVVVEGTSSYSNGAGTEQRGLVDADRHVQTDVLSSALPTGAATSAKQDTGNTSLASIDGKITAVNTGAVVVSSSALPTGAATAANQQTDALTDAQLRATAVPVSGTVTANLGATDNAVLDDIAANQTDNSQKTQIVDAAGNAVTVTGNKLDVNASVSTTGLATDANQTTIIGHLDGVEGLLTDIEADTDTLAVTGGGTETGALRVTVANNSTGVLSVDDNGSTLSVDDGGGALTVDGTVAVTNAGLTALNGAISGTEVQVDVLTMPTTTVQATNLDVRDLAQASDNVRVYANTAKDGSGTGYVPLVDTDGHLQIDVLSMPAGGSGLTDAELRATPVPVSGTVTANLSATDNAVLDAIAASVDTLDSVDYATQTTLAAINTKLVSGTDIGDVTINNASGASAVNIQDGGNSITVDGTVAVTNAGLTELAAAINASSQMDVNIAAGNITGFATSAKQDTIIGHVDGIEGLLTTIDADTGGILTSVQTLDNAISGNEMQVDVVGALPAGSAIIGKVGHDITGIGHGVTTVTTAGTDVALAASTACKKVTIQAQTDNTSAIAVGASGVDATIATGTGILLFPGDSFELEIDNLADIFIDSLVNGEGVRYVYFT